MAYQYSQLDKKNLDWFDKDTSKATLIRLAIQREMNTLDRQKLDVVNKLRSTIFGWRGQFTPEFSSEMRVPSLSSQP